MGRKEGQFLKVAGYEGHYDDDQVGGEEEGEMDPPWKRGGRHRWIPAKKGFSQRVGKRFFSRQSFFRASMVGVKMQLRT